MWFRMGRSSRADSHCCLYLIARLYSKSTVLVWSCFSIPDIWLALEWGNAVLPAVSVLGTHQSCGDQCHQPRPLVHPAQCLIPASGHTRCCFSRKFKCSWKDSYQITCCSGRLLSFQCKAASALQLYSLILGFGCKTKQFFCDLWRI